MLSNANRDWTKKEDNTMSARRVKIPDYVKQTGPKVETGTVKVYKGGKILRISTDLLDTLMVNVVVSSPFRFTVSAIMPADAMKPGTLILTCIPNGKSVPVGTSV